MQSKFQEVLDRTGLKTASVARETGIPYNTLNDWRKGRTKKISLENVSKLAEYFNVPVAYFLDDDDAVALSDITEALRMPSQSAYYDVAAGSGRINDSYGSEAAGDSGQLAKVVGDSMYPSLHDGDVVRFVEAVDVEPKDFALVRINGDELTVKHVEWSADGLWVRAENKDVFQDRFYTVREISTIPVQIVGKAVELRRNL